LINFILSVKVQYQLLAYWIKDYCRTIQLNNSQCIVVWLFNLIVNWY